MANGSTIGKCVTANMDHVCQSHYSLDVTEFRQSLFADTIEMNEKCQTESTLVAQLSVTSLMNLHFLWCEL